MCEVNYIEKIWHGKVFIACFTTEFDNVKLWREYSDKNKTNNLSESVCIEINKNKIENFDEYIVCTVDGYKYDNYSSPSINHLSYFEDEDWAVRECCGLRVVYKESPEDDCYYDEELIDIFGIENKDSFKHIYDSGYVKKKEKWEIENEYRIRAIMHSKGMSCRNGKYPKPEFEYVYLDISNWIKHITVFVNKNFTNLAELKQMADKTGFQYKIV